MTENKIVDKDKNNHNKVDLKKDDMANNENQQKQQQQQQQQQHDITTLKDQQSKTEQHDSRFRRLSQFLDFLNIPRHHSGHSGSSSSSNNSQQHSPQTPHAASEITPAERRRSSNSSNHYNATSHDADGVIELEHQQHHLPHATTAKRSSCVSSKSEILIYDFVNGEISDLSESTQNVKEDYDTQRIYKKSSPNCVLTMYLPSREIILSGNNSSILTGIVFVDPKVMQGYKIYAQLTLTFRYGREDEEVMGLRFCNEAIMSLHQIWPRKNEPNKPLSTSLQEALLKRLGDGALPFTLTLTAQAPPSVQLVPAKSYYGAPIGTSYDVRCFIAGQADEKFHRRASVKMSVRVIYRTDVFSQDNNAPENFASLINNTVSSPSVALAYTNTLTISSPQTVPTTEMTDATVDSGECQQSANIENAAASSCEVPQLANKSRKSERGDSFPKLRLSPKSFRFSGRFGRSKSEVDKYSSEAFHNYSKSFQDYDSVCPISCAGPQGAVDKPFLLQDGRVGLRASLDKAWYSHGEDICVTINIRNDSKKTVRKIRVCAIQHVDVCMFNNGKFKNVVADSDNFTPPIIGHHVTPGATLNTTVMLRPQRGVTKNWIALEDTLQRSTEPDEIKANIAASAVRTPHFLMQTYHSPSNSFSPPILMPAAQSSTNSSTATTDERNVFAIYVSYYVKVKLTLSGMGGELSLKLPFLIVHVDEEQRHLNKMHRLSLEAVPGHKKSISKTKMPVKKVQSAQEFVFANNLDRIESVEEGNVSNKASPLHIKDNCNKSQTILKENNEDPINSASSGSERRRNFKRSETLAKDLDTEEGGNIVETKVIERATEEQQQVEVVAQVHGANSSLFGEQKEEDNKKQDNEMPFNKKIVKQNSKNPSEIIIQPMTDNSDTKNVNEITTVCADLNPASDAV